jgi:alpha/beta superfamily hydrolase
VATPVVDSNAADAAALTAVLLHPHPDMGGDRFNHVVDALYLSLPNGGFTTVRFDFSSSDIATAAAETTAVIDGCRDGGVALIGYSFGAGVALHTPDPRLLGWLLVAPYLPRAGVDAVALDPRPKLVLVPEHDQWSPPRRIQPLTAGWANTTVATVTGADHFLGGRTGAVVAAALGWLDDLGEAPV